MAGMTLNQENPTLTQAVFALRDVPLMGRVTRDDVVAVCHERGVKLRDGRILEWPRCKADVYFAVARRLGVV